MNAATQRRWHRLARQRALREVILRRDRPGDRPGDRPTDRPAVPAPRRTRR